MAHKYIPYGHHWIDEADIEAVVDVLRSDWITQGELVGKFEVALAQYCQARFAVAVSSATAALHIACLAAGVKAGQTVLTSPITFVASANCALYCGAHPRLIDIDSQTYNLAPIELERFLEQEPDQSNIAAIIPVHFSGQSCDMESISQLVRPRGVRLIEDASHALGGNWTDNEGRVQQVGNCAYADMTVFSFHPVKHITTGEGGAVLTNDEGLYRKLLELRSHGITKNAASFRANDGPWHYEMQTLGFNYRITDFQCALGLSQLSKLDAWIDRRHQIARQYDAAFRDVEDIIPPYQSLGTRSAYHLYAIQMRDGDLNDRRMRVFQWLRERNIGVQVHYIPVHLQPFYQDMGYREGDFPVAESYYKCCLSLPIYPKMTDEEVGYVIDVCCKAVAECRP